MQLKLKTVTLQSLVARAIKGASCNKLIPITGMMCIRVADNVLTLETTDGTNYLYMSQDKVFSEGENFEVTVWAETFAKLVARLTCEDVVLDLQNDSLRIIGNGKYSVELPLDEEGELAKFPNPRHTKNHSWDDAGVVNLSTIRLILTTAKAALAVDTGVNTDIDTCYTGYYCGNRIVATDSAAMCGIDIQLWDEPALISPEMMRVLDVFSEEKIHVYRDGSKMLFETYDCALYGSLMDSIADYQIDTINSLLELGFDSRCYIQRSAILELLDRLVLFVGPYDKNAIDMTFTASGLQISSKKANSVEIIPYTGSDNFKPFTCSIDIELLRSQIKSSTADVLELHYGLPVAIKFVDGNVTQVIALLEEA